MAKKGTSAIDRDGQPDPLADAVDRLTGELALLRQVMDEIREDFSWLTRNGLPVQTIEHVHVKRMAIDPCAEDWGERLEIERSTYTPRGSASPLDSDALDQVVEDLKATFEAAAQGQLEVVLSALDGVRAEILGALRRRGESAADSSKSRSSASSSPSSRSSPTSVSSPPPANAPPPKPPPGQLFSPFPHPTLPKEQFLYPETKSVFDLLEETSHRSSVSRGQAFEDFLHMSVCTLSGGQMEEQYMAAVQRHTEGKPGKRGCDSIAHAFGQLVHVMEETRQDVLGDLFQGSITYGEAGQYLTPEPLCQMMAAMTVGDASDEEGSDRKTVCDPCCGSGRMLLAVADLKPHWEFVGQDVDLRCVRMTAINLALRSRYGYVVWGNSLSLEKRLVYRTGLSLRGVIREIPIQECPERVRDAVRASSTKPPDSDNSTVAIQQGPDEEVPPETNRQLRLF